jgi:hypothetical protein
MSNKKVYLAKNILASGFDVEYVRSSLLRIPGINIVEAGMGIKASECAAFVVVGNEDFDSSLEDEIVLSKDVAKDLKDFLKNSGLDCPEEAIYIFSHENDDYENDDDIEKSHPLCGFIEDDIEILDKNDFDAYAQIAVTADEDGMFLAEVSDNINVGRYDWEKVPLHHKPKAEYAIPPVPSLEERRLKKMPLVVYDESGGLGTDGPWSPLLTSTDRRFLLLRRKI